MAKNYKLNPFTGQLDQTSEGTTTTIEADLTAVEARLDDLEDYLESVVTVTADYTADAEDQVILVDASSNTVTVTMPTTPSPVRITHIKCIDDTNTCDVAGGGNNIDGSSDNFELCEDESITLIHSATGYHII